MNGDGILPGFLDYVGESSTWLGADGLLLRIAEHLLYTGLALGAGALIAMPIGLFIGHTNRGSALVTGLANAARALPILGLLLLVVLATSIGLGPVLFVLVILAVPPILSSTYAGIRSVDPNTTDAARGIGMTERKILFRVEIPMALPLIMSGLRAATLQVVSTATIAAIVALGGLGRPLLDSIARREYPQAIAAALLVAALAIVLDLLFAAVTRLITSPGLRGAEVSRTAG